MSFPKDIYVCNLSSPLTFVGLTYFVTAVLECDRGNTKVVIINIEHDYPGVESDLPSVDAAAHRLLERGILLFLVLPEGSNGIDRYFKRDRRIGIFRSVGDALKSAKTFLDSGSAG